MNLQQAVQYVQEIPPGGHLAIHPRELDFIGYEYNGVQFTPCDCILEKIVGSSYEYSYRRHFPTNVFVFERLEKPLDGDDGRRTYVSPDRLDRYIKRMSGIYELIRSME